MTIKVNEALLTGPADSSKIMVASDMEGTLSAGTTWKGMRDYLDKIDQKSKFNRYLARRIVSVGMYYAGLNDRSRFRESWALGVLGLFAGSTIDEFEAMAEWVIENEIWPNRRVAVIEELRAHQAEGRRVVIVSGMFEPLLRRFAAKVGCEAIGTPVEYFDGRFTGNIRGELNTGPRKVNQLKAFADSDEKIFAAYGDMVVDVPMLEMCQHPTVVHPDRAFRAEAQRRGWRIIDDVGG